jgi:hypothetical protein
MSLMTHHFAGAAQVAEPHFEAVTITSVRLSLPPDPWKELEITLGEVKATRPTGGGGRSRQVVTKVSTNVRRGS